MIVKHQKDEFSLLDKSVFPHLNNIKSKSDNHFLLNCGVGGYILIH
jgi:hypothetical protein